MAVASTEYKVDVPYAIFETKGKLVNAFKEKPSYAYQSNAGIYILKKELINIINKYDIIVDGSDNFKTKFLLNKYSLKFKKILIVGAISKFDGHIFTFDFNSKKSPCLKCFYQSEPSDEILNCEAEGILGSTANIVGAVQVNEVLKKILNIGKDLKSNILILDLLNLNFRKVLFKKKRNCVC